MKQRRWSRIALLLVAAFALVVTSCGSDSEGSSSDGGSSGGGGGAAADFKACDITDTGGVDDKSFNQTVDEGIQKAKKDLGIEVQTFESKTDADYETNLAQAKTQDCDLTVTVGFLLGDATKAAAEADPDRHFAIVDYAYADEDGKPAPIDNVKELTFSTDQAAFLAGYLAAGVTKSGKVATYGGIQIPTVTIFMDGFLAGVKQYNEDNGKNVEVLGWDGSNGQFVGNFEDSDKGKSITQTFLDDGADIVMPVAGPVGAGTIAAVKDAGGDASIIWVDTDGCVSVADSCQYFLTSVQKKMDTAVYDTIKATEEGSFDNTAYVGTLENKGVDIAPYHDHEGDVPEELTAKIEEYRQKIISGDYKIGG